MSVIAKLNKTHIRILCHRKETKKIYLNYKNALNIYIYIYILSYTDKLFRSIRTLQCKARHVRRSKVGSKPVWLNVRLNFRPLGQQAYHVGEGNFLRYYVAAASVCLHFDTLSATRVLNSFEELCIMRAVAENSFARVLNPHGGAYILSSTDRLFRSIRTLQWS